MMIDRSTKTLIAIFALVAALFLAMDRVIQSSPLSAWVLPGILFVISAALWVWIWQEDQEKESAALAVRKEEEKGVQVQEWIISKESPAAGSVKPDGKPAATAAPAKAAAQTAAPVIEKAAAGSVKPEGKPAATAAPAKAAVEGVKAEAPAAEKAAVDAVKAETPAAKAPEAAPKAAPAKRGDTKELDDLTRIEGIGPKFRDALLNAGITTFVKLADTANKDLEAIIKGAGLRRPGSMHTWAEQATYLANGDMEGFEALTAQLKGGMRRD